MIESVQKVKGQRWAELRDRRGDQGRELVLYLGRRVCEMKWGALAGPVGLKEYASAAMAVRRYGTGLRRDRNQRRELEDATRLLKVKM